MRTIPANHIICYDPGYISGLHKPENIIPLNLSVAYPHGPSLKIKQECDTSVESVLHHHLPMDPKFYLVTHKRLLILRDWGKPNQTNQPKSKPNTQTKNKTKPTTNKTTKKTPQHRSIHTPARTTAGCCWLKRETGR